MYACRRARACPPEKPRHGCAPAPSSMLPLSSASPAARASDEYHEHGLAPHLPLYWGARYRALGTPRSNWLRTRRAVSSKHKRGTCGGRRACKNRSTRASAWLANGRKLYLCSRSRCAACRRGRACRASRKTRPRAEAEMAPGTAAAAGWTVRTPHQSGRRRGLAPRRRCSRRRRGPTGRRSAVGRSGSREEKAQTAPVSESL
mmetsp:Transcript_20370/g.63934  ORF Transcript_20370/g.63934 Transcript_20370/m.63934 type:complete len:203 (+) Transcript_20370:482-1090(+)